jgi:uncharacterized protein YjbI with pentapeptide repeats
MKFTSILISVVVTTGMLFAQPSPPSVAGAHTDLSGSHSQQVNLANARFEESDLSKITFRSINFTGAVLTSCNLSGVQIFSSDISGMKIDGVLVTDLLKTYQDAKKK